ncbi:MAG: CopG family transcriptional regulator [Verrucomicrobia bacterium]|nr:MAG: CopG family transcriptional regulator [Verrucomicrobiota bacterium]
MKKSMERTRAYGRNKKAKNMRFTPETIRKLIVASQTEGVSQTVYVEKALRNQFQRDDIK